MVFTTKDYNSNDGMMTSIWGPAMWHFLHTMSFNYPIRPTEMEKKSYRDFILSLKNILPCGKCRKNLLNNFKKLPLTLNHMKSRDTFSRYVFDLHEIINVMLCKPSNLSYDTVREKYEYFRARCANTKTKKNKVCKTTKIKIKSKSMKKKEDGCIIPFHGKKQKCILRIVPDTLKCKTFS